MRQCVISQRKTRENRRATGFDKMNRIRIKNFGPIKKGYTNHDGWMTIKNVSVFIGTEGSGKSTVAKLISTMSWIEKAFVRGDFGINKLTESLFKRHVSYQNIGSYFNEDSIIEYEGLAYFISYKKGQISIEENKNNGYSFPKIMYVPSERNLVSVVRNVNDLKGLPSTLYTFSDEYDKAVDNLKGFLDLPINGSKFEYQKLNKYASIVGVDYKISLSEASSGFQSFVPLFVVSNYLAGSLGSKRDNAKREISINEERRIRRDIEQILANPNISEDVKKVSLEILSSKLNYSAFINIVEEPEQNLFPSSQHEIINSLIRIKNSNINNKLVLTTHSPYIINYLSVAIQGGSLMKHGLQKGQLNDLNSVVPQDATLQSDEIAVFQLSEKEGSISDLPNFEGIPSDKNYLNEFLAKGNQQFDKLLEIEQGL